MIDNLNIQKIWATGFFDGEGHISIVQPKSNPRTFFLQCAIVSTDYSSIDIFHQIWGGGINQLKKNGRSCWRVTWYSSQCLPLILDLLPYSRLKTKQLELAKDFINTSSSLRKCRSNKSQTDTELDYKLECFNKMKEINDSR